MRGATQLNSWNDRNVNLSPVCSSFDARPAMRRPKAERSRASIMKLTIVQKFCQISPYTPRYQRSQMTAPHNRRKGPIRQLDGFDGLDRLWDVSVET